MIYVIFAFSIRVPEKREKRDFLAQTERILVYGVKIIQRRFILTP
jgi:hypothetical protein